ncbi:MAG: deoxyuridine 5'-triphosphate nucleotidohydrolase [Epsilonproteobacteria bacterium]|nr:deoxyuridine 5'-triphosphate nucleotidohydrolase [Campylobacterota bacterium]
MIVTNVKYFDEKMPKLEKKPHGDWIDVRAASISINGEKFDWLIDDEGKYYVPYFAGQFLLIGLGIAIQCPDRHEAHVAPRSSTFKNYGLIQTNSVGVIDWSYRGNNDQWFSPMLAMRDGRIEKYDRIAQFRFVEKMPRLSIKECVEFVDSVDRGGYGSTGVK